MKGEKTYSKYKRQNEEMKSILSSDVQRFILDEKDAKERIIYLRRCMETYRVNKSQETKKEDKEE